MKFIVKKITLPVDDFVYQIETRYGEGKYKQTSEQNNAPRRASQKKVKQEIFIMQTGNISNIKLCSPNHCGSTKWYTSCSTK